MAPILPRITAPSSTPIAGSRVLRTICIVAFPFGLILFLIHGILTNKALPAAGLVPLAGSALLGGFLLRREGRGPPVAGFPALVVLLVEVALVLLHAGMVIPTWISMNSDRWYPRGFIILGTFCSVFLLVELAIHVYFVLARLFRWAFLLFSECPHCHSGMGRWGGHPAQARYAPFTDAMLYTESDVEAANDDAEASKRRSSEAIERA